jgi:hypothetical protein
MSDHLKTAVDVGAVGTAGATLIGLLPHIASILSIIWLVIRIYETRTVQRWLGKEP